MRFHSARHRDAVPMSGGVEPHLPQGIGIRAYTRDAESHKAALSGGAFMELRLSCWVLFGSEASWDWLPACQSSYICSRFTFLSGPRVFVSCEWWLAPLIYRPIINGVSLDVLGAGTRHCPTNVVIIIFQDYQGNIARQMGCGLPISHACTLSAAWFTTCRKPGLHLRPSHSLRTATQTDTTLPFLVNYPYFYISQMPFIISPKSTPLRSIYFNGPIFRIELY